MKINVRYWVKYFLTVSAFLSGCTADRADLGSEKNPVKFYFTPAVDAKLMEDSSRAFKEYLEKNTPYKFEVAIPQSFIAVVEAFGTKRADVAAVNTFGYILANRKYGAQARLTFVRNGSLTYQGQFLARADGPIKKLSDFIGKKMAFVDPASTSGFLLPKKILKERNILPKVEVFAMKHDSVVTMIYQGQVDGGATYYSPPLNGEIQDARRLVLTQYPDVEKKIKIVELTEAIPNDPVIFRKDLPEDMKRTIVECLIKFVATPEGKKALDKAYGADDLKLSSDAEYESVKKIFNDFSIGSEEMNKQ